MATVDATTTKHFLSGFFTVFPSPLAWPSRSRAPHSGVFLMASSNHGSVSHYVPKLA